MKRCPTCQRTYDDIQTFCIEDGAVWGIEALFRKLARKRQLRAFVAPERFYEIGSTAGRAELEQYLKSQPADAEAPP